MDENLNCDKFVHIFLQSANDEQDEEIFSYEDCLGE